MTMIRKCNDKAVNIRKSMSMNSSANIVGKIEAGDFSAREAALKKDWYKIEEGYVLASLFEAVEEPEAIEGDSDADN